MMPTASQSGVVEIDGPANPFWVQAGDDYPEGGVWREEDPPRDQPKELPPEPEPSP